MQYDRVVEWWEKFFCGRGIGLEYLLYIYILKYAFISQRGFLSTATMDNKMQLKISYMYM